MVSAIVWALGTGQAVAQEGGGPDLARTLYMHVHPDTVQTARLQATMAWLRESFHPAFAAP